MTNAEEVEEVLQAQADKENMDLEHDVGVQEVRRKDGRIMVVAEDYQWVVGDVLDQLRDKGLYLRSIDEDIFRGVKGYFLAEVEDQEEEQDPCTEIRDIVESNVSVKDLEIREDRDGDYEVEATSTVIDKTIEKMLDTPLCEEFKEAGYYVLATYDGGFYLREEEGGDE